MVRPTAEGHRPLQQLGGSGAPHGVAGGLPRTHSAGRLPRLESRWVAEVDAACLVQTGTLRCCRECGSDRRVASSHTIRIQQCQSNERCVLHQIALEFNSRLCFGNWRLSQCDCGCHSKRKDSISIEFPTETNPTPGNPLSVR